MADTDRAPQLGNNDYPNLNPSGSSVQNAKDTVYGAQSAIDAARNHPLTQSIRNGPVADNVRNQAAKTSNDFNNLASARRTPDSQTVNGQPLTHYHSLFYSLLSWENPRATAISYAIIVSLIFAGRYLNVLRYVFKGLYMTLGVTAAAEVVGKVALGNGLASQMRPRKYFTIRRETLESVLGDLEQIINFFVIEFQRILFAENVWATIAAFAASLLSYFLIKVMPTWGLGVLAVSTVYFVPLAYISNQEFIDHHLDNAQSVVSQQTNQIRDLAAHHTGRATESVVQATKDYTAKAQEMIGGQKSSAPASEVTDANGGVGTAEPAIKQEFPHVPSHEPQEPNHEHQVPVTSEPVNSEPEAVPAA
ncbi:hypothetical protein EV356DRAFT_214286 [Viridothelium virens]|uniref:Reticulon-like protein n=1 Tax=Viridothelium virens TaxID=1048519 RepID=A0A6A6H5F4_VIRVR|nr:hypothetical protein EV356DRAFT_214286 [Viridothelium virens]